jgi:fumarylacetoacetate (FAA) hydrolase family protein
MSDNTDDEVRAVAAEIVGYLRAHPDAADTVEGAARWWLRRPAQTETLDRAMTLLVNQRIVEKHKLPEGTTVFRGGPMLVRPERPRDRKS